MQKMVLIVLAVSMLTMGGCGKTLDQIKATSDRSLDTAKQTVASGASIVGSLIDVVKTAIGVGLSVYQDVKDNANTAKEIVLPSDSQK